LIVFSLFFTACPQPDGSTSAKKTLERIAVTAQPAKTAYLKGENLDLAGMVVTAYYSDSTSGPVEVTAANVTGYDKTKTGTQTLTVTVEAKTDTFNVTVMATEPDSAKTLEHIEITGQPTKTAYSIGEELNLAGAVVTAYYTDGTSDLITVTATNAVITGYDKNTVGTQTLTLTMGGKTATLTVTVTRIFTSIDALAEWLQNQPGNTAAEPYAAALGGMNISALASGSDSTYDALGALFNALNGKYVSIDISRLTGTAIADSSGDAVYYRQNKDKLVHISLPAGVTSLGEMAFAYCSSLTSITLPASIASIGDAAFADCTSLTSITLPASITSIRNSAFAYCSSLSSITLPASIASIGDGAFYACAGLASITLPNNLITIGTAAFALTGLSSVTLPASITSIGNTAFAYCSSLTSITLPASIGEISVGAFYVSPSLSFTVTGSGQWSASGDRKMLIQNGTNLFACPSASGDVTVPDGITSIGDYAFIRSSLTSVALPDSLSSIGDYAFVNCQGITSITLPDSLSSIGSDAFSYCSNLALVTCNATIPPSLGNNVFNNTSGSLQIKVPDASVGTYQTTPGWIAYAGKISAQ
jgi:hypothetical protein